MNNASKFVRGLVCALLLFGGAAQSWAKEAPPASDDPVLEARVMKLASVLRCLVCQNQTIAESNADLASDLREQIREQLKAGRSEQQVIDFLVKRYGDFVLYKPPFMATTVLLWTGPFILLVLAAFVMFRQIARRRRRLAEATLSDAERARARDLLGGDKEGT